MFNEVTKSLTSDKTERPVFVYRDLGIGFVSSLVATGISFLISSINLINSILIGVCVFAAASGFILGKKTIKTRWLPEGKAGIVSINVSNKQKIGTEEIINQVRTSLTFWGISAKRTISSPSFRTLIESLPRSKIFIKFLLLDPNSEHLERKAKDEGDNPEAWRRDVAATITRIKELMEKHPGLIELHTYKKFPIWRVVFLDDNIAITHFFPSGRQGPESPQIILEKNDSSLFEPIFKEFKETWDFHSENVQP